jgi:large conductance mechanosensitive channel
MPLAKCFPPVDVSRQSATGLPPPRRFVKALHTERGVRNMTKEFIAFLKQYGVIGLAIAVIIGGKLNDLVKTTVDGILMPVVTAFVPGGDWRTAVVNVGPVKFVFGPVIGAMIDFIIVALLVFWLSKKILREEVVMKK